MRIMKEMFLKEISAVDRPAQPLARVVMMKAMSRPDRKAGESDADYEARCKEHMGKRDFSEKERAHDAKTGAAMEGGGFPIENEQDLKNAISAFGRAKDKSGAAKHIRARAQALGLSELMPKEGELASLSKADDQARDAANGGQGNHMTPEEKAAFDKAANELVETKKALARAEKLGLLNDVQKAHLATLGSEAQDAFLNLDTKGRETELAKAADSNPVVYKSEIDGTEFRKNDGNAIVAMAKRLDLERKARIDAENMSKAEDLRKRAGELKHLPGEEKVLVSLLKAVDTLPEAERAPALAVLKAQSGNMETAFGKRGVRGQPAEAGTPEAGIEAIAKRLRDENTKLTEAQAMVKAMETPEGKALYAKHVGN